MMMMMMMTSFQCSSRFVGRMPRLIVSFIQVLLLLTTTCSTNIRHVSAQQQQHQVTGQAAADPAQQNQAQQHVQVEQQAQPQQQTPQQQQQPEEPQQPPQQRIDYCGGSSNTNSDKYCLNGGTCRVSYTHHVNNNGNQKQQETEYICDCSTAFDTQHIYDGTMCQYPSTIICVDNNVAEHNGDIQGLPYCVNGGVCGDTTGASTTEGRATKKDVPCICPDGYAGFHCEFALSSHEHAANKNSNAAAPAVKDSDNIPQKGDTDEVNGMIQDDPMYDGNENDNNTQGPVHNPDCTLPCQHGGRCIRVVPYEETEMYGQNLAYVELHKDRSNPKDAEIGINFFQACYCQDGFSGVYCEEYSIGLFTDPINDLPPWAKYNKNPGGVTNPVDGHGGWDAILNNNDESPVSNIYIQTQSTKYIFLYFTTLGLLIALIKIASVFIIPKNKKKRNLRHEDIRRRFLFGDFDQDEESDDDDDSEDDDDSDYDYEDESSDDDNNRQDAGDPVKKVPLSTSKPSKHHQNEDRYNPKKPASSNGKGGSGGGGYDEFDPYDGLDKSGNNLKYPDKNNKSVNKDGHKKQAARNIPNNGISSRRPRNTRQASTSASSRNHKKKTTTLGSRFNIFNRKKNLKPPPSYARDEFVDEAEEEEVMINNDNGNDDNLSCATTETGVSSVYGSTGGVASGFDGRSSNSSYGDGSGGGVADDVYRDEPTREDEPYYFESSNHQNRQHQHYLNQHAQYHDDDFDYDDYGHPGATSVGAMRASSPDCFIDDDGDDEPEVHHITTASSNISRKAHVVPGFAFGGRTTARRPSIGDDGAADTFGLPSSSSSSHAVARRPSIGEYDDDEDDNDSNDDHNKNDDGYYYYDKDDRDYNFDDPTFV